MEKVKVAHVNDLEDGHGKTVTVQGNKIALFKQNGKFHAMDNTCLHRGGPLGEGDVEGTTVTCPWHRWEYDMTTGHCKTNPALKLKSYKVEVKGDEVFIEA